MLRAFEDSAQVQLFSRESSVDSSSSSPNKSANTTPSGSVSKGKQFELINTSKNSTSSDLDEETKHHGSSKSGSLFKTVGGGIEDDEQEFALDVEEEEEMFQDA